MNEANICINGIYDLRTLKQLNQMGVGRIGFEFNPKSFTFIQEHVFLDLIKADFSENKIIYLNFKNNKDVMIGKIVNDLTKINPNLLNNLIFVFDEYIEDNFNFPFLLKYSPYISNKINTNFFIGFIFDFSDFEIAYNASTLTNLISNLYTKFPKLANGQLVSALNINWTDNLFSSLFDFMEFEFIQLNINYDVEVCYRNVDLNKLNIELKNKKKYLNL